MERFSIVLFSLCSLALLTGSIPIESTTIGTLWDNAHDVRSDEEHANLLKQKSMQNNAKHFLLNENFTKNSTQVGEHAKNPLYSNKTSVVSATGYFSDSDTKDTQHVKHNGDQEDDASHKNGPSIGLLSHDILLDPSLIPARLNRQAEKGVSKLASIENHRTSSDVTTNNYSQNRSVIPSKSNTNLESDLGVAEDRYQSPYPYWNPYYGRQFPNQRYQPSYRREPYRNYYWRYPVFPGK